MESGRAFLLASQNDWKHLAGEEQCYPTAHRTVFYTRYCLTSHKTFVYMYVFDHLSLELNSILHRNTKYFCMTFSIHSGEGSGNPLQSSCLENPEDGGAWWAAIYGVAQSRIRLKQFSSSCNIHRILQQCNFNINCGEITLLSGEFISLLQFLF